MNRTRNWTFRGVGNLRSFKGRDDTDISWNHTFVFWTISYEFNKSHLTSLQMTRLGQKVHECWVKHWRIIPRWSHWIWVVRKKGRGWRRKKKTESWWVFDRESHRSWRSKSNVRSVESQHHINIIGYRWWGRTYKRVEGGKTPNYELFTGNHIGVEGARALSQVLRNNTTLKKLYLGGEKEETMEKRKEKEWNDGWMTANEIREEGTRALSEVVKENTTMTFLDLWSEDWKKQKKKGGREMRNHEWLTDNHVEDEGARALSQALKENYSLETLKLGCEEKEEKTEKNNNECSLIDS